MPVVVVGHLALGIKRWLHAYINAQHAQHTDGQVSRQQQALVQRVERQEKELVILRHEAAVAMVGGSGGAAAEETRYVGGWLGCLSSIDSIHSSTKPDVGGHDADTNPTGHDPGTRRC